MTIVRIDAEARWSDVVIHNNTLYYTGVPANLDDDAFEQTANTLAQIDAVLEKQGSNKSRILDATIFLPDGDDFAAMNNFAVEQARGEILLFLNNDIQFSSETRRDWLERLLRLALRPEEKEEPSFFETGVHAARSSRRWDRGPPRW